MENRIVGNKVYIDIDIVFEDFYRSMTWQSIKKRLPAVEDYTGRTIAGLRIRPSSSGNAHIELSFAQPLTVLENLTIRAWLNDDIWRLRLDLVRYLKTSNPARINRLWSGKWKKLDTTAEMRLCGEWRVESLAFMPAARAAWQVAQAAELQKHLNETVRKEEMARANEGMAGATVPGSRPANPEDYDPGLHAPLTLAPVTIHPVPPPAGTEPRPDPSTPGQTGAQTHLPL